MHKFKIRCSAIGSIMAGSVGASQSQLENIEKMDARDKPMTAPMLEKYEKDVYTRDNPELPKGAKTYCKEWLKEQKDFYNRRKEIQSKYCDKGNEVEDDSIELLSNFLLEDLEKNEEFFGEDEFMQGTPDVLYNMSVYDMKNSWDFTTFPLFEDEIPNKDYWWQLQGYMYLCSRIDAKLVYCLMDMPYHLIQDEVRRASYKSDMTTSELSEEYTKLYTYKDVSTELRVKIFDFDRDDKAIEQIKERVKLCQEYINKLMEK